MRRKSNRVLIFDSYDIPYEEEGYSVTEVEQELLIDELRQVDKTLNGTVICIADVGRWNGRFQGVKKLKSLEDIAYVNNDSIKLEHDGVDIFAEDSHHDGTNYYRYRLVKDDKDVDDIIDRFVCGGKSEQYLLRNSVGLVQYLKRAGLQ